MKTIILAMSIIVMGFVSCEKCETCITTTVTSTSVSTPGYPQTTKTTFEACGDQLKQIDGNKTTSTAYAGNISATSTATTICQ